MYFARPYSVWPSANYLLDRLSAGTRVTELILECLLRPLCITPRKSRRVGNINLLTNGVLYRIDALQSALFVCHNPDTVIASCDSAFRISDLNGVAITLFVVGSTRASDVDLR